jgi:phosphoribosylamine--glycine ligase
VNVLIIGSGGREHALALAIAQDPTVGKVHVAPGNPGTANFACNHPLNILDGAAVAKLARTLGVDLVVIGPEAPLVAGVADAVRAAGIACFGPSEEAARLEGSKAFAKRIMDEAAVPTAACQVCDNPRQAASALDIFGPPYVVKNDGLAAGKGVLVTTDRAAALAHATACGRVVIEEYLDGPEVSLFVITDGKTALPLLAAQDFKRVGEHDTGANTGGMGAYCPLPWAPANLSEQVMTQVALPTIRRMAARNTPFIGLLYCGLALTSYGLKVVEFNARFGDPETEVILPLLASPLGQLLYAAATGTLDEVDELRWRNGACVGVVLAANGYPGELTTKNGHLKLPRDTSTAHMIHASTGWNAAELATSDSPIPCDIAKTCSASQSTTELVATGGRVLVSVGTGTDIAAARQAAYKLADAVDFPSGFYRQDIAAPEQLTAIAQLLTDSAYSDND